MSKVYVLIGVPGSGKTTYANKVLHAELPVGRSTDFAERIKDIQVVHISSDNIREELYGNEAEQSKNAKVFEAFYKRLKVALEEGKDVVLDATNINRKTRKRIFENVPKGTQVEAHIVWAAINTAIYRDSHRDRVVGKEVILKIAKRFEAPWYDEGFSDIKLHYAGLSNATYYKYLVGETDIEHENPHHYGTIKEHCERCYYAAVDGKMPDIVVTAAMLHDVGKPLTKIVKNGTAHYYNHDNIGGWMVYGALEDKATAIQLAWLVSNHMQPYFNSKYYQSLKGQDKMLLDMLHACDRKAH